MISRRELLSLTSIFVYTKRKPRYAVKVKNFEWNPETKEFVAFSTFTLSQSPEGSRRKELFDTKKEAEEYIKKQVRLIKNNAMVTIKREKRNNQNLVVLFLLFYKQEIWIEEE